MSGSNFDNEIKDAMTPKSKMQPPKPGQGKRPPPSPSKGHDTGAVPSHPPAPHHFEPPTQTGQNGLQQATSVPAPGMQGPTPQQGSGLHQAHATIIDALARRDRGM